MQFVADHAGPIVAFAFLGIVLYLTFFFKGFKPGNSGHSSNE